MKFILLLTIYTSLFAYDFFYDELSRTAGEFLVYGISIGIVFMAAIYSLILYHYNRKNMLILYFFLQISIVVLLINTSGIFLLSTLEFGTNDIYYKLTAHFSSLFAFLFAQSFLETKKFLPIQHRILNIIVILLSFEILYTLIFSEIFLTKFVPYSFLLIFILFASYTRQHQGFKPAMFYLIGLGILIFTVALSELTNIDGISPMYIGCPIEAILVAMGLTYSIRELQEEQKFQQAIMIHQAKLASMGELLGNIAHQWRQPISALSYIFMNIKSSLANPTYIASKIDEGQKQIEFMSDTIDNFRDFYRPETQEEFFSIVEQTSYAVEIIRGELYRYDIQIDLKIVEDKIINNFKNQYIQAVINILSNAKEALIDSKIDKPMIVIVINGSEIQILDNGKGIPKEHLHKIFEPYFTTKFNNSGIGLYMTKIIVENNMKGKIHADNTPAGTLFTISL